MNRTRLLCLGSGAVPRLPDAVPSNASDRSFPLQAIVRATDSQSDDLFGQSVAVSGNVAIIGASGEAGGIGDPTPDAGAAYVFYVSLLEAFKAN